MNSIHAALDLDSEQLAILAQLAESERAKLLVEIRHAHHRAFRDELRHRLSLVEGLIERCGSPGPAGPETKEPGD